MCSKSGCYGHGLLRLNRRSKGDWQDFPRGGLTQESRKGLSTRYLRVRGYLLMKILRLYLRSDKSSEVPSLKVLN